jgi:hypothetical protein
MEPKYIFGGYKPIKFYLLFQEKKVYVDLVIVIFKSFKYCFIRFKFLNIFSNMFIIL